MDDGFADRVEGAENHVKRKPEEREPTRPVAATKHKNASNNRQQPQKTNPQGVILKRTPELSKVVRQPDYPSNDQQSAD